MEPVSKTEVIASSDPRIVFALKNRKKHEHTTINVELAYYRIKVIFCITYLCTCETLNT